MESNRNTYQQEYLLGIGNQAKIKSQLLKAIKIEISQRLNDSLHKHQLQINQYLELPILARAEAVDQAERSKVIIPPETKIIDVFYREDVAGRLLILGKPGLGKTTTLLRLAKELIEQAENDFTAPVPVIFELSNWQKDKLSIEDWLIQYLKDFYSISDRQFSQQLFSHLQVVPLLNSISDRQFSRRLLIHHQILPLLDGLDELELETKQLCLTKINEFLQKDSWRYLVVCCCNEEDKEGKITLTQLNGIYCLQSPKQEEIYRYLQRLDRLDLWDMIQNNSQMWEFAEIPLLLNMMITVDPGKPINHEAKLFRTYIDKCLQQSPSYVEKRQKIFYTAKQTRRWLTFLARQLKAESQTEFLIENMQPTWLESSAQKWLYILINTLIFELINVLIWGLILGMNLGLFLGLILGMIFLLIAGVEEKIVPQQAIDFDWQNIKAGLIDVLIWGIILGLIFGLILWVIDGLILALIYRLSYKLNTDIKSKETPNQGIKESLKKSLFISVITTLFYLLIPYLFTLATGDTFWLRKNSFTFSLGMGIFIGLLIGGIPCIQHFSLRLVLWKNGLIPWNYSKFLKYTAQRKLIQQVGGRYRFRHDSLRQQFIGSNQ